MSKASEFAKAADPMNYAWRNIEFAYVTRAGTLHMSRTMTLEPPDALAFAHWILDTFGEAEKPPASSTPG